MNVTNRVISFLSLLLLCISTLPDAYANAAQESAKLMYLKAQKLENTNLKAARAVYTKIVNKYKGTVDPNHPHYFEYSYRAKQRLRVIDCLESDTTRKKYNSLNEFYAQFKNGFKKQDKKLLEQLISCELRVGLSETDDFAIEEPRKFAPAILRRVKASQLDLAPREASHIDNVLTGDNSKNLFLTDLDEGRAAIHLKRDPDDKYSFEHVFIFQKNGYWQLDAYHTSYRPYLKELRQELKP